MNTHKLKPNDYRYGIKLPNTKYQSVVNKVIDGDAVLTAPANDLG